MVHFSSGITPAGEEIQTPWTSGNPVRDEDEIKIGGVPSGVPWNKDEQGARFNYVVIFVDNVPWGIFDDTPKHPITPPFQFIKTGRDFGSGWHTVECQFESKEGHRRGGSAIAHFYVDNNLSPPPPPQPDPQLAILQRQVVQLQGEILQQKSLVSLRDAEIKQLKVLVRQHLNELAKVKAAAEAAKSEADKEIKKLHETLQGALRIAKRYQEAAEKPLELGAIAIIGKGRATVAFREDSEDKETTETVNVSGVVWKQGLTLPNTVTVTMNGERLTVDLTAKPGENFAVFDYSGRKGGVAR